ncbi:MAG: HNH endonuclease [Candidatus Acidiferrales bacterium]
MAYQKHRRHENPQVLALMRSPNWLCTKDYLIALGNVHCQRVSRDEHRRCRNQGRILHHIIPNNRAAMMGIFYDQRNLVMVCQSCHPSSDSVADQGWYTPTLWVSPGSDEKIPEPLAMPGNRVGDVSKLWTIQNRVEFFNRVLTAT